MSPRLNEEAQAEGDQLAKILEVISEIDTSFIKNEQAIPYLNQLKSTIGTQKPLNKSFDKSSPEIIQTLENMLTFNPKTRMSAKKMLKSTIFDGFRDKKLEREAREKLFLDETASTYEEFRKLILKCTE